MRENQQVHQLFIQFINYPTNVYIWTRFFTGDFASWTVHFSNICMKNQQIHQLCIQIINYVW